jgi:hypothetical protein
MSSRIDEDAGPRELREHEAEQAVLRDAHSAPLSATDRLRVHPEAWLVPVYTGLVAACFLLDGSARQGG